MKKLVLNNCNYNCIKQLSKHLEFLWNVDGYIRDAKDCGHGDCEKVFESMKKDAQKHTEMLKVIVERQSKEGGFS